MMRPDRLGRFSPRRAYTVLIVAVLGYVSSCGSSPGEDAATAGASTTPSDASVSRIDPTTAGSSAAPTVSASMIASEDPATARPTALPGGSTAATPGWMSGAGGTGVADGTFAAWRGSEVEIATTWADNDTASVKLWQLLPGGEYAEWTKPIDIAVGAFDAGGSWAAAARGDYDARWRSSLTAMAQLRAGRGTTYVRFAHEFNGDWYPWSVSSSDLASFRAAWARYRAIQLEVFPSAKLVFCANRESTTDIIWTDAFPGRSLVDVVSVDYYNQYPFVDTAAQWKVSLSETTWRGEPKGLALHLAFAQSVGLPLAISEWSESADFGDSPVFVEEMRSYVEEHAGSGPGEIIYESLFNANMDSNNWAFFPTTRMPQSAAAYQTQW